MTTTPIDPVSELDQMRIALVGIALDNIEAASRDLLDPRPVDLEVLDRHTYSSEQQIHSYNVLEQINNGDLSRTDEEVRESNIGQPAIAEDDEAHRRICAAFARSPLASLRSAVVTGEEAGPSIWDITMEGVRGTIVADTDPLDGSGPYDSMACGFSTNITVYSKLGTGRRFQMLLSIVVASSGHWVAWQLGRQLGGRVFVGHGKHLGFEINEPRSREPRAGVVAMVAAMPHHRERAAQVLATRTDVEWSLPPYLSGGRVHPDPTPAVYTMGGAPATIGLVIGRLSAMGWTSPQTIHDTAGVPAMLALGLPAYSASGPVDRAKVMRQFTQLDRPESGSDYTPIPPMVIGRDEAFVKLLADVTLNSGPMELVAVPKRPTFTAIDGGKQ